MQPLLRFVWVLLCMSQVSARYVEKDVTQENGGMTVLPAASPSSSLSSSLVSPPGNATEGKSSSNGLDDGKDMLIGFCAFGFVLIFLSLLSFFFFYRGGEKPGAAFMKALGLWHFIYFDQLEKRVKKRGIKVLCCLLMPLPVLFAALGIGFASGIYLGLALFFFIFFVGLVSDDTQLKRLDFAYWMLRVLFVSIAVTTLMFFSAPILYFGEDDANKTAVAMLCLQGLILGGGGLYAVKEAMKTYTQLD